MAPTVGVTEPAASTAARRQEPTSSQRPSNSPNDRETLGFSVTGGNSDENRLSLRNSDTDAGRTRGMFDEPILTFGPRIDQQMQRLDDDTGVRDIQVVVQQGGIDPDDTEPAHIVLADPDGHRIMTDQFWPRPDRSRTVGDHVEPERRCTVGSAP